MQFQIDDGCSQEFMNYTEGKHIWHELEIEQVNWCPFLLFKSI